MAFVPAPQIVRVEVRALKAGQQIENVFDIDALTTVTPTIVDDICNKVNVWAQSDYFDHLPSTVTLREVVATDLTDQNGYQHTITPEGTFTGALNSDPMPNEVSFTITHKSSSRGRSARGRSYVLGLIKGDVSENLFSGVRAGELVADFNTLRDAIADGGYAWVVVSYRTNNAPRPGGPVYFPIVTNSYADLVVDSMRRRKPGVGS